jgi:hypothetical protein
MDVMTTERKARKPRADSKEEAVKTFIASVNEVQPPDDMEFTDEQRVIFDEVIGEFAKVDWTPHAIRLAALLARTVWAMQKGQEALLDEGYTIINAGGRSQLNPTASAVNQMASQMMSLRRSLALHAMAAGGKGKVGVQRGHHKAQEEASPMAGDDEGLIARPPQGSA